jgi:hypothetical protein
MVTAVTQPEETPERSDPAPGADSGIQAHAAQEQKMFHLFGVF